MQDARVVADDQPAERVVDDHDGGLEVGREDGVVAADQLLARQRDGQQRGEPPVFVVEVGQRRVVPVRCEAVKMATRAAFGGKGERGLRARDF